MVCRRSSSHTVCCSTGACSADRSTPWKERYRCIRFDFRGQGHSEVAASGYDLDTLTADVAELIGALNAGPCHFVGLSMGGFVGLRLALRATRNCSAFGVARHVGGAGTALVPLSPDEPVVAAVRGAQCRRSGDAHPLARHLHRATASRGARGMAWAAGGQQPDRFDAGRRRGDRPGRRRGRIGADSRADACSGAADDRATPPELFAVRTRRSAARGWSSPGRATPRRSSSRRRSARLWRPSLPMLARRPLPANSGRCPTVKACWRPSPPTRPTTRPGSSWPITATSRATRWASSSACRWRWSRFAFQEPTRPRSWSATSGRSHGIPAGRRLQGRELVRRAATRPRTRPAPRTQGGMARRGRALGGQVRGSVPLRIPSRVRGVRGDRTTGVARRRREDSPCMPGFARTGRLRARWGEGKNSRRAWQLPGCPG